MIREIDPFLLHDVNGLGGCPVPEGRNAGTFGHAALPKHLLSETRGHRASTDIADTYEKNAHATHIPRETRSWAAEQALAVPVGNLLGHVARKLPQPATGRLCLVHQRLLTAVVYRNSASRSIEDSTPSLSKFS